MSRAIDSWFYHSKEWKRARDNYITAHPLCEICQRHGRYVPAKIVHHKIHLNEHNFGNPNISLNPSNLLAVCEECHNKLHSKTKVGRRYEAMPNGEIIATDDIDLI